MAKKKVERTLSPDLVRVRALNRGYYAPLEVIEIRQPDGKKLKEVGRNDVIRNEGEVFEMDTGDMKPGASKELETVKTERGEFILPTWVTLVSKKEKVTDDDLVPAGHHTAFKKDDHVL